MNGNRRKFSSRGHGVVDETTPPGHGPVGERHPKNPPGHETGQRHQWHNHRHSHMWQYINPETGTKHWNTVRHHGWHKKNPHYRGDKEFKYGHHGADKNRDL